MTSEYPKGGLDLHSATEIVIKIKMIVLDGVKKISVVGNSRMCKLKVELSGGIVLGVLIYFIRGEIHSHCVHLCKDCGWAVKPVVKVMGLDLILDCSLWIIGPTHSGKEEHLLLHSFITAFSPGMSFVVQPTKFNIQRSMGLYFTTLEIWCLCMPGTRAFSKTWLLTLFFLMCLGLREKSTARNTNFLLLSFVEIS